MMWKTKGNNTGYSMENTVPTMHNLCFPKQSTVYDFKNHWYIKILFHYPQSTVYNYSFIN